MADIERCMNCDHLVSSHSPRGGEGCSHEGLDAYSRTLTCFCSMDQREAKGQTVLFPSAAQIAEKLMDAGMDKDGARAWVEDALRVAFLQGALAAAVFVDEPDRLELTDVECPYLAWTPCEGEPE